MTVSEKESAWHRTCPKRLRRPAGGKAQIAESVPPPVQGGHVWSLAPERSAGDR